MPKISYIKVGGDAVFELGRAKESALAVSKTAVQDWAKVNPLATTAQTADHLAAAIALPEEAGDVYVHVLQAKPLTIAVLVTDHGARPGANWWAVD